VHRGTSPRAKDQMYHPSSSFVYLFLFLFLFIHLHHLFFLSRIHRGFTALHSHRSLPGIPILRIGSAFSTKF